MPAASSSSVRVFYPRYSRDQVLNALAQGAESLRKEFPLSQLALFGSYAAGRHTVGSDIDVLVVYQGKRREDAFAVAKRALGLFGVEPHVYSEQEAQQMKATLDRMTHEKVVVYRRPTE